MPKTIRELADELNVSKQTIQKGTSLSTLKNRLNSIYQSLISTLKNRLNSIYQSLKGRI